MAAVKQVLGAIPELEVVELDVPVVSTQASHLSVLPKFKAELREREFRAAAAAGVTTFASIFHGCHRELVKFQPEVSFELLNFMELIGEAMGIHIPDLYKRLSLIGDIDTIIADTRRSDRGPPARPRHRSRCARAGHLWRRRVGSGPGGGGAE